MEIARIPRWPTKSILQDLMLQNLQQFHDKLDPPFDIISVASLLIHSSTPRRGCKKIEISAELVEYLFWNTGSVDRRGGATNGGIPVAISPCQQCLSKQSVH
jgi:hypothetical protein